MPYRSSRTDAATAFIDGWPVIPADAGDAAIRLASAAQTGEAFMAGVLDLDRLAHLRDDSSLQNAYRTMRFVFAGSASLARLARRQLAAVCSLQRGDLVVALCRQAAQRGLPVFLVGPEDGTLARTSLQLTHLVDDDLAITGTLAPASDFDPAGDEALAAIAQIRASGARICILALGSPQQELFALRAIERGAKAGFVCLGECLGALDGRPRGLPHHHSGVRLTPPRARVLFADRAARLARQALLLIELWLTSGRSPQPDLDR